jgi:hypothetical protein
MLTNMRSIMRVILDVPNAEAEQAEMLGARWDSARQKWYVPHGMLVSAFECWLPTFGQIADQSIDAHDCTYDELAKLGLRPLLGREMSTLFTWLFEKGLTASGRVFDSSLVAPHMATLSTEVVMAESTRRQASQRLTQAELKAMKEKFKTCDLGITKEAVWTALQIKGSNVRTLEWKKLPADAMAFYRPFHFPPFNQWGIYLRIGPLLNYHETLVRQSNKLKLFSAQTLMHLILFEVFNHEFFHHMVESTAATLEMILATQGAPQSIYLNHRIRQAANTFMHPHAPLEEALANAYAYNSLSFISRIKAGFKTANIKAYQDAIEMYWPREPRGYRDAGLYTGANYIDGGALLLAQMLNRPTAADEVPLSIIAKHVMPNGFTALMAKPDIPTWLVGSADELATFYKLVPAPNEAYSQLFWPYNTDIIDSYVAQKKLAEKKERAAQSGCSRLEWLVA